MEPESIDISLVSRSFCFLLRSGQQEKSAEVCHRPYLAYIASHQCVYSASKLQLFGKVVLG